MLMIKVTVQHLFGEIKNTDLIFAADAVLLAESLEVLVMVLKVVYEQVEPLELKVS